MRVIRTRHKVEVSGSQAPHASRNMFGKKLAKQRKQINRLVACSIQARRRRPRNDGHGLPRSFMLGTGIDLDVKAALEREAARRRIPLRTLTGIIIETVVDDDLFIALLGEV